MAKTQAEYLKDMLGGMQLELSRLMAENESLREQLKDKDDTAPVLDRMADRQRRSAPARAVVASGTDPQGTP